MQTPNNLTHTLEQNSKSKGTWLRDLWQFLFMYGLTLPICVALNNACNLDLDWIYNVATIMLSTFMSMSTVILILYMYHTEIKSESYNIIVTFLVLCSILVGTFIFLMMPEGKDFTQRMHTASDQVPTYVLSRVTTGLAMFLIPVLAVGYVGFSFKLTSRDDTTGLLKYAEFIPRLIFTSLVMGVMTKELNR